MAIEHLAEAQTPGGRRMTLKVVNESGGVEAIFQATGNVIDFPGFFRAYVEGADDPDAALSERETILPAVTEGEAVTGKELSAEEHATTPPARLTEATLVKALEESGIGRPSTYASIIDTILRREYSFKKASALVPTFTAFAVVALISGTCALALEQPTWDILADAAPEIAYVGVLSSALTFTLLAVALRHTPAAEATIIVSTETVFAAVAGVVLLGEQLLWIGWFGAGLMFSATMIVQLAPDRRQTAT